MTETNDVGAACSGLSGTYGPNDNGYLCLGIREAAKRLVACSELWSEGHYPHSNAKVMSVNHPIATALAALCSLDEEIAVYANEEHDPSLFEPYQPSKENMTRWNRPELIGVNGDSR